MGWEPFDGGITVGKEGSECGIIVRDEEHDAGARITLEKSTTFAPFAVTCGIYRWFFHTRYLAFELEAEFSAMRDGLAAILDAISTANDSEGEAKMSATSVAIEAFVARFP